MSGFDIKDIERRMDGAIDSLKKEFGGLRTGRDIVMAAMMGAEEYGLGQNPRRRCGEGDSQLFAGAQPGI